MFTANRKIMAKPRYSRDTELPGYRQGSFKISGYRKGLELLGQRIPVLQPAGLRLGR